MEICAIMFYCSHLHVVSDNCPNPRHLTEPRTPGSLPPLVSNVTAFAASGSFPPEDLFAFTYPFDNDAWCSGTNILPQNVTINLTEPLVIYGLLSGGYSDPFIVYVNMFSLEYSEADNSKVIVDHLPKVGHTSV